MKENEGGGGGERGGPPKKAEGGGGLNKFLGTKGGGLLQIGLYLRGGSVLIEDFHYLCKS